jgi:leucyl-tRNA synthetase
VLISYGTGAIMAVPAHDERDFEFALQFKLPIRPVVMPPADWFKASEIWQILQIYLEKQAPAELRPRTLSENEMDVLNKAMELWDQAGHNLGMLIAQVYAQRADLFPEAFTGNGTAINSGGFNGLATLEFKARITAWLQERALGAGKINYKLRDWLFSRQRYWGEPFPILHELDEKGQPTGRVRALSEKELPLTLPELEDFKPSGKPEPPLGKASAWVNVTIDGKKYQRETNTMPKWAGSCWYYLRYLDPKNSKAFCDPAKEKTWMPVDLYVGGAEHAVLHLLYARFWHKVLFDRGHVHTPEPFGRLVNQGMILGEMEYTGYKNQSQWASAIKDISEKWQAVRLDEDQVEKHGDSFVLRENPKIRVDARAYKMSKSRGNVINPDQVVDEYGADSMRLYEMFMGPLESTKPWSMRGVEGVFRFLNRVWRLFLDDRGEDMKVVEQVKDIEPDKETLRLLHQTIKRVTNDLDTMSFNTAIAAMMELSNFLTRQEVRTRSVLCTFILLLSPFAPHLAEELWCLVGCGRDSSVKGHAGTIAYEAWPTYDDVLTKADQIEVPIQINGKLRSKINVPADIDEASLQAAALAEEKIKALLEGKTIKKVIVVRGKLVNIVIG